MAAEPEEYGIEATDLASLLCRFEEATSSETDVNTFLNTCIQESRQVKYRSKIIQFARNASDTALSSDHSLVRHKSIISRETLQPSLLSVRKGTSAESTFFESPCCLVESPPAPGLSVSSGNITDSKMIPKETLSNLTEKTTGCRNIPVSGHNEISPGTDTLESFLMQNESMFPDVVSLQDISTHADILEHLSSTIKTGFTDEFFDLLVSDDFSTNNALFSTVAMSDVADSQLSCDSVSALLHQNNTFFKSDSGGEIGSHDLVDVEPSISDTCLGPSFHNLMCDQSSCENVSSDSHIWEFFCGSDHSYCSRLLPATECVTDASEKSCCTVFTDSQENAVDSTDHVLSQCISDIFGDSCSVSKSTDAVTFFLEEQEICIDSDGNDLYCHPSGQLVDCEMWDDNFSSLNTIVQTAEKKDTKRKMHNSPHAEITAGPLSKETSTFFDKIPSYYTALSISPKPVTTTIFASTTKTIGSTDHLDFWDSSEPIDDSHYDKVPAHRRIFTNTAKEVETIPGNLGIQNVTTSDEPVGEFLQSTSSQENSLTPLTVENLAAADKKHLKRSHSPYSKTPGRCSRSPIRRSASSSRFSRHSASSSSDCSTCSSCSKCSTCSLSRSCSSSGSERGSSLDSDYRTRSRSPVSRSNKFSAEGTRCSSPESRHSKSRTLSSNEESEWRSKRHKSKSKHNSEMDIKMLKKKKIKEEEQVRAMEERRIVYVGKIPDGYTKKQLYQRFQTFGEIKEVKVNFREHGDNYGFVTFAYSCDAVAAKEKGNSKAGEVKFDLCFGGRRHFCPDQYADLDGNREIEEEYAPMPGNMSQEIDYAALLKLHSSQQKKK